MNEKFFNLILLCTAAVVSGCVTVDDEVASVPSVYWKAPKEALPERIIEPQQIKTNGIESAEVVSNAQSTSSQETISTPKDLTPSEKLAIGKSLSLSDLIDIALENNTSTRIYWFQAKNYAAQKGKSMSAYYPQVSVGAQLYRTRTHPSYAGGLASLPIGRYYETSYGPSAEINWLLWDFGKREAQINSAEEALRAANFEYNQSLQDVVLGVNVAYFNFYSAYSSVESARLSLEDAKIAYESAKVRTEQGVGNKQDMLNALANFRNAEFALEQARSSVETARAELAKILGVRVSANFVVSTKVEMPISAEASKKIEELTAKALRSRQDLFAEYAKLRQTESQIKEAERNFLPQLSAYGQASYGDYTQDGRGHQSTYTAGLSLSWSLFEGFAKKYDLISARVAKSAQAQQLKESEISIISDVWNYYHSYLSATKQVASTTAAVEANIEAYNATKTAYENGVSSITEFLNAQSRLAAARKQKVSAEATLSVSVANLAHAVGSLSATTLNMEK